MNKAIYIITIVGIMATLAITPSHAAEERYEQIEMADGNHVWIRLTPEAVTQNMAQAENAPRGIVTSPPKTHRNRWVLQFEMPDGRETITFPMTADEIQTAKRTEAQSMEKKRAARAAKVKETADVITTHVEMADGMTVAFTRQRPSKGEGDLLTKN